MRTGLPPAIQALLYGLLSALSLPIGALLGIALAPVHPRTSARWMAFGSGALVFAVATQLYGEVLEKLSLAMYVDGACEKTACNERYHHVIIQACTGLIGSILYVLLNRALAKAYGASHGHQSGTATPEIPQSVIVSGTSRLELARLEGEDLLRVNSFRGSFVDGSQGTANVALSMWLGLVLDGIPEAFMLGFMSDDDAITWVFLGAIFIANFPEAFSGASILVCHKMRKPVIFMMWTAVFVLTGVLAMVGSLIMPDSIPEGSRMEVVKSVTTVALEGLTGGAMLAMISTAMLPEAFKETGEVAGIFFVLGFVVSVLIDGIGTRFGEGE